MIEAKVVMAGDTEEFPKIMYEPNVGATVLFHKRGEGVVIATTGEEWKIGDHATSWDMGPFRDFHGTITLTNK